MRQTRPGVASDRRHSGGIAEDDTDDGTDDETGGIPALLARRAELAALWTGFGAAVLGGFAAVVVALAMWVPDAAATGTSGSTVRGGILAFLAAQHGGVRIDGVGIGFVPLGLTMFVLYLCRRSGRALWSLPVTADDLGPRRVCRLIGWQCGGYAVTTTVASLFAVVGTSSASPVAVVLGSVAVGSVGFGSIAATATPVGDELWRQLADPVRAAVRGGVAATAVLLAGGAVLVLASTAIHAGRFLSLSRGMGRGLSGLPIAVGDILAAPNAVVAATSYVSGPGFTVGHAGYAPFGGHGGLVPAFPVLAGLPVGEHASLTVLTLMAFTVLGAGIAAGLIVRSSLRGWHWGGAMTAAFGSGVGAGIILAVLTALGGGSLGAHALRTVGAPASQVGLAVLVEVGLVASATVALARIFSRHASGASSGGRARVGVDVDTGVNTDVSTDADADADVDVDVEAEPARPLGRRLAAVADVVRAVAPGRSGDEADVFAGDDNDVDRDLPVPDGNLGDALNTDGDHREATAS